MTTILLINPNTNTRSTEMMLSVARPMLPEGVTLHGATATVGAAMILDEAALVVAAEEVVRIGLAEAPQVDAIIVSAFGNPGAGRLRALVPVPVIGIGQAAIRKAADSGGRFGIATTTPNLVHSIEANVRELGLQDQFTGVRVPAGDPLALAADPKKQDDALALAVAACIEEDGADTVVIGGGPLSDTAARLRSRLPTRIIEPVPSAIELLMAQFPNRRS